MKRERWTMGWQMPRSTMPPSPPQDAAGATNRVSNMNGQLVDDATAAEVLKRLQVDGTRSRLAQAIFPYNDNYKRVSEWKKAVGGIVASDIRHNAWLRHQMHLLGYQERKVGYSYAQQLLLVKFYVQQGVLKDPSDSPKGREGQTPVKSGKVNHGV